MLHLERTFLYFAWVFNSHKGNREPAPDVSFFVTCRFVWRQVSETTHYFFWTENCVAAPMARSARGRVISFVWGTKTLQRYIPFLPRARIVMLVGTALCCTAALARSEAQWLDYFSSAADAGQCIESVTFTAIRQAGDVPATPIVQSALRALALKADQQRALGCAGDIAAQAIAAGADPDAVLAATAAGL